MGIINEDSTGWSRALAWSNLYKISFSEGGNPTDPLCDAQMPGCLEALRFEIGAWKPKRVLFMTGGNWLYGFEGLIGRELSVPRTFKYVEKTGFLEGGHARSCSKFVVVKHPQGKNEAQLVKEVLHAFDL